MNFIKLVKNELTEILKKKSTILLIILSILSIPIAYMLIDFMPNNQNNIALLPSITKESLESNIANYTKKLETATEKEKAFINEYMKIDQFILDNGFDNIINGYYKNEIVSSLKEESKLLLNIDRDSHTSKYSNQEEKVNKLWKLLESGSFEDYIEFNIEDLTTKYNDKAIQLNDYNFRVNEQKGLLKYEIGKTFSKDLEWKSFILADNIIIDSKINLKDDWATNLNLEDNDIKALEEQKLINDYRLKNNVPPYYLGTKNLNNTNSYRMHTFNNIAAALSMFVLGLLIIIISTRHINGENKKEKCASLFARILSALIILFVITLILSQLTALIGKIFFGNTTDEYLYVKDGSVKVIGSNLYITLRFLLRTPRIIIYMLLGITLSTLIQNKYAPNIITILLYVAYPIGNKLINSFITKESLVLLPFNSFDFSSKFFRIYTYGESYLKLYSTSVSLSVIVFCVTALLLFITTLGTLRKNK